MALCECGCNEDCAGKFLPGHDQRLRTQLEARIVGLLSLRDLVDAAELYAEGNLLDQEFTQRVRKLLTIYRRDR